ncbi:MAG TPA: HAMP domain-containing sensor histidine kinase [Gemmatimonadales bacterium]
MRDSVRLASRPVTLWSLLGVASFLIVVFAVMVARHLTRDARRASQSYAEVFRGLASASEGGATDALFQQMTEIREQGIPIVVTDSAGVATDTSNMPEPMALDSPAMRTFIGTLDRFNAPLVEPQIGIIHFGAPPVRRALRWILASMVASLLALLGTGVLARRVQVRAGQDRVFVAMARESAHQLGTPLTSLAGWIEQLRGSGDEATREVAEHLAADYRRLERVSRRFERIGQPPREERVDVGALATAAAAYFRPRMPRLANAVQIDVSVDSQAPVVSGDPLLLEWALEALVKNAVDALRGRSGTIHLTVGDEPDSVVLTVEDDGPGVPQPIATDLFEPGITTKTGGWGLGLALTRRIVEEGFHGRVQLEPSAMGGARFAMRLPRAAGSA